jgi:uncharacterized lipoprotein YehR (DUF1307 family)
MNALKVVIALIKSLLILSLIFILTGCGESEVKAQEPDSKHPIDIAYESHKLLRHIMTN